MVLNPPSVKPADGVPELLAPKLNPVEEVEAKAFEEVVMPRAETPPDCVATAPNVAPANPVVPVLLVNPLPKPKPVDFPPKATPLVVFGCAAPN